MDVVAGASTGGRRRPGCRASGSSSPASARPATRCGWRSRAASGSSTSRSEPELERAERGGGGHGPRSRRSRSGSIPDVDARTHAKIATGKAENKFGVPIGRARAVYAEAARLPGIEVVGIDVHIGSQLTELAPYEAAFAKVAELTRALRADGHDIRRLDLGGGLGIPYRRVERGAAAAVRLRRGDPPHGRASRLRDRDRAGAADRRQRRGAARAGDLPQARRGARLPDPRRGDERPDPPGDVRRLARHRAGGRAGRRARSSAPVDVVGPVCETGDTFAARARRCRRSAPGDLVAFRSAGAYGAVMASEYNSRPLVPEVLVQGDHFAVVRARPSFDEMLKRDTIPDWIGRTGVTGDGWHGREGRADEAGDGGPSAGATRWRGSSAAAAPPWRSSRSPGPSGRSARRWR